MFPFHTRKGSGNLDILHGDLVASASVVFNLPLPNWLAVKVLYNEEHKPDHKDELCPL